MPTKIPTNDVRKAITQAIGPLLQAHGFRSFRAGRCIRQRPGWIDVVEVGFSESAFAPRNWPSLAIGRWLDFLPDDPVAGPVPLRDGRPQIDEPRCHLRKRVHRFRTRWYRRRTGHWQIDGDPVKLRDCVSDMVAAVEREIIPWFDRLEEPATLFELFASGQGDIEGRSADSVMRGSWGFTGAFDRQVNAGYLAARCGRPEVAAQLLSRVLREGGVRLKNGEMFALSPPTLEHIRATLATL